MESDGCQTCVRFEGDLKKSVEIEENVRGEIKSILKEVDDSKKHIVFIDGYVLNGRNHVDVREVCYIWLKKDRKRRRLVDVCSMPSRYKANYENDKMLGIEEFYVYSWKEEEYLAAVKNNEFLNHVRDALDSSVQIESPQEDLNPAVQIEESGENLDADLPKDMPDEDLNPALPIRQDLDAALKFNGK